MSKRAAIIGGGVIGLASAHYLHELGWQVTVIDRGEIGGGCSHANCGFICPSHVLPLCVPGALKKTLKAMWQGNSPLKVRMSVGPALWGWLWRFSRNCNERAMHTACRARQPLLESSMRLYEELVAAGDLTCEWQKRGLLNVYRTPAECDAYEATDRMLEREYGLGAKRLNARETLEFEPALRDDVAGAWLHECDAHLRPDRLMSSWQATLAARGVKFLERCELKSFAREGSQAKAAETSAGRIEADAFVLAIGALAPRFAKELGCKIPIQPGKGYSITMPRPTICPSVPMIFPEHKVAITPFLSGYRIGSTMEFAGYDSSINRRRLSLLTSGAALYLCEPQAEPIEEEWSGWRPMSADGIPLIGRTPAMQNVLLATGHSMVGVSMGPATGKLVAEMIAGEPTHIDPAPYDVRRF